MLSGMLLKIKEKLYVSRVNSRWYVPCYCRKFEIL